jgi:environmental stress-induced protein Ves
MVIVDATAVTPQPWRNGGGQTRELLTWPTGGDWRLRISQADIECDGPFSVFAEVRRWFTVIHGAGVVLVFADGERTLRCGDEPLCFDGGQAPGCRLLGGPTQDLNLMARVGSSTMCKVAGGQHWDERYAWRGIYTAGPGSWRNATQECALAAHSLLWATDAGEGPWVFTPDESRKAPGAWWLGYTPQVPFV